MSNYRKILQLKQARADLADEMLELSSKREGMTSGQRARFDELDAEQRDLDRELRALELVEAGHTRNRPPEDQIGRLEQPQGAGDKTYERNFSDYLRTGEKRDLALSTQTQSTATSVLVAQSFSTELEAALKYYGPMLDICRVHPTPTGAPLPWPTSNDTGNEASIVGEGTQVSEVDATISSVILGAYKYSTGVVKVSIELLQDAAFPLEQWLAEQFGKRLGRKLNTDFTTGAGTTEPYGLLTQATAGPTATGSANNTGGSETGTDTIGTEDLVALEHSVDPAYRKNAVYMANDSTVKKLKQLLDKYGRPIFEVSETGKLATINGYPLYSNPDMPALATGNKTMLFGEFQKYVIRQVKDLSILRLTERYADYGQVGFIGFARLDGRLIDAGTHPVKYLVQA